MRPFFIMCLLLLLGTTSCRTYVKTQAPQSKVVVVKTAPRNHKIVVIKGQRYYYWGGKHYKRTRNGYVVVRVN